MSVKARQFKHDCEVGSDSAFSGSAFFATNKDASARLQCCLLLFISRLILAYIDLYNLVYTCVYLQIQGYLRLYTPRLF